eukprot:GEMP01018916.1.p1 GENE.GEMP01018916.1~~GEMP01018916.1.p1  ORF type:complete len:552 (+),score=134.41 GEMP01018916.1:76-1731(+)
MPPESRVRALADHVICPYACAGDANAPRSTQKVESRDVTAPTVHYGRARSEAKDDIPKFSWFDSPYRKMRNVLMDDLDFYHGVPDHVMRLPLPGPYDNIEHGSTAYYELIRHLTFRILRLGASHTNISELQRRYGGNPGAPHYLSTNICYPLCTWQENLASKPTLYNILATRAIIGNPDDAARLASTHLMKEDNFKPVLHDSVISTDDMCKWRRMRQHLTPAFLPYNSLAIHSHPASIARARVGIERLQSLLLQGSGDDGADVVNSDGCVRNWIADMMDNSGERSGQPSTPNGPLTALLRTMDESRRTVFGNYLIFAFAGHDTTGNTMTWMLYELVKQPELLRQVQEEVDHVLKEIGCQDGDVSLLRYADLHKFEILTRCITETLRLWPAVPNGSFRKLQHDDVVTGANGEMVTLPAGTRIQIPIWCLHRNPALWGDDADQFKPLTRNFTEDELPKEWNGKVPESKRFAPFMFSPRGCIGRNFAQMEMRIIFAHLLHYFDFALHEKYVNAENYFGINRGTLGPKDLLHTSEDRAPLMGLHMHVTRRPVREG